MPAGSSNAKGQRHPLRRELLYATEYAMFVTISALDVIFTTAILHMGGREVNFIADKVIQTLNLRGMIVFKFSLVILVICMCEFIGRHRPIVGKRLALLSVALTCVPVTYALYQISSILMGRG